MKKSNFKELSDSEIIKIINTSINEKIEPENMLQLALSVKERGIKNEDILNIIKPYEEIINNQNLKELYPQVKISLFFKNKWTLGLIFFIFNTIGNYILVTVYGKFKIDINSFIIIGFLGYIFGCIYTVKTKQIMSKKITLNISAISSFLDLILGIFWLVFFYNFGINKALIFGSTISTVGFFLIRYFLLRRGSQFLARKYLKHKNNH